MVATSPVSIGAVRSRLFCLTGRHNGNFVRVAPNGARSLNESRVGAFLDVALAEAERSSLLPIKH